MSDWWDAPAAAPAPAAFTPPRLAIIDGAEAQPARPVQTFKPAKPEPKTIPLSEAWMVGFWDGEGCLEDIEVLTWDELKARRYSPSDSRWELDLWAAAQRLAEQPYSPSAAFLPPPQHVWHWFMGTTRLADQTGRQAAKAFARIDGLKAALESMLEAAQ